jgi:AcrR family transcriptional regulator
MATKKSVEKSASSEERIKEAARKVFTRKGYAATRTRDIAEEAGINLALLNYYFRSKEKLFQEVMAEKVQQLFAGLLPIVHDPATTLTEKIALLAEHYTTVISLNPDLPFFVLYEIRNDAGKFVSRIDGAQQLKNSVMFRQLKKASPDADPYQMVVNLFSLLIFPFVARNMLHALLGVDAAQLKRMLAERQRLIPAWMEVMMKEP